MSTINKGLGDTTAIARSNYMMLVQCKFMLIELENKHHGGLGVPELNLKILRNVPAHNSGIVVGKVPTQLMPTTQHRKAGAVSKGGSNDTTSGHLTDYFLSGGASGANTFAILVPDP